MNFYPVPKVIQAEVFVRIPDKLRCLNKESEWRGGFSRQFQWIFLEGPVADANGNLYVVDVPYGRVLKIDVSGEVTICAQWDGEPNGLAADKEGNLIVADYKQVRLLLSQAFGGEAINSRNRTERVFLSSIHRRELLVLS